MFTIAFHAQNCPCVYLMVPLKVSTYIFQVHIILQLSIDGFVKTANTFRHIAEKFYEETINDTEENITHFCLENKLRINNIFF